MNQINVKANTVNLLEGKRHKTIRPWIRQWCLRHDATNTSNKIKKQIGLHQNLKLSCFTGHNQENEDMARHGGLCL